jgi:hypothetical protein
MDRTAIAAIVIGFGATVAAMVMPQKYPNAPKFAIELSWWGGIVLIVVGGLFLLTDITVSDVIQSITTACNWLYHYLVALVKYPAFWIVMAFVGGIAAHRWLPMLWKKFRTYQPAGSLVTEWFSPMQAAEKFVSSEFISNDRLAHERAKELQGKVRLLEAQLEARPELNDDAAFRDRMATAIRERDDSGYLAKQRRTDVVDKLSALLTSGFLIGKGCKSIRKGGSWVKGKETNIPTNFWNIIISKTDVLDLTKRHAIGYLGFYEDVLIGKDENFKAPQVTPSHPGLTIKH